MMKHLKIFENLDNGFSKEELTMLFETCLKSSSTRTSSGRYLDLCKKLIDMGLDYENSDIISDIKNTFGFTEIYSLFYKIISKGDYDFEKYDKKDFVTTLEFFVENDNIDYVENILKLNPPKDKSLSKTKSYEMVSLLLKYGFDINVIVNYDSEILTDIGDEENLEFLILQSNLKFHTQKGFDFLFDNGFDFNLLANIGYELEDYTPFHKERNQDKVLSKFIDIAPYIVKAEIEISKKLINKYDLEFLYDSDELGLI